MGGYRLLSSCTKGECRTALILLVAPMLFLFSPGANAAEYRKESKNYIVITDVEDDLREKISLHLEAAVPFFRKLAPVRLRPKAPRQEVYVFSSLDALESFSLKQYGEPIRKDAMRFRYSTHYSREANKPNQIFAYRLPNPFMFNYIRAQAMHLFLMENLSTPPTWLSMGLAHYVESARFDPEKGFEPIPGPYIRTLREGILGLDEGLWKKKWEYVELKDLFLCARGGMSASTTEAFNSESWLLVMFILKGKDEQLKKRLAQYISALTLTSDETANLQKAFTAGFGSLNLKKLGEDFLEYVKNWDVGGYQYFLRGYNA